MPWRSLLVISLTLPALAAQSFVPDFRVKPDDYTVLMAADAKVPLGLKVFQEGAHGKFHVTGWTRPEQTLEWDTFVQEADAYAVNTKGNPPALLEDSQSWTTPGVVEEARNL